MDHISRVMKITVDQVAERQYGMTRTDALKKGICVKCRNSVRERIYSDAGAREYKLSGLCELCYDEICPYKLDPQL